MVGVDFTVVIPTYNEEAAIGKVIEELLSVGVPRERILVVDGHSTDRTVEVASSYGVRVIYQVGRGKGLAVITAIAYCSSEFLVFMDGDFTYPASEVWKLLHKAVSEGCVEVIGARVFGRENIPLINRFGNAVINAVFNLLFKCKLRDVCSGMYVIRRSFFVNAPLEARGFNIEVELAGYASRMGKVCEVPIKYRRRIGEKKLKPLHGLHILLHILKTRVKTLFWRPCQQASKE